MLKLGTQEAASLSLALSVLSRRCMKKAIFITLGVSSLCVAFVAYSYIRGGCVDDMSFAKSRVISYMKEKGYNSGALEFDKTRSAKCVVSFIYKDTGNTIYLSVIDGGKVTWWDTNERGPL